MTYLSSAGLAAISILRVYKVTALMDFRKEVVFFSLSVGGGSEASCLSSFNWFPVAIGAGWLLVGCFFFFSSSSHESAALQSTPPGFRSAEVSGELSRILHLSSQTFSDLQLTLKEVFSSGGLCDWVHSNRDLKDLWKTCICGATRLGDKSEHCTVLSFVLSDLLFFFWKTFKSGF